MQSSTATVQRSARPERGQNAGQPLAGKNCVRLPNKRLLSATKERSAPGHTASLRTDLLPFTSALQLRFPPFAYNARLDGSATAFIELTQLLLGTEPGEAGSSCGARAAGRSAGRSASCSAGRAAPKAAPPGRRRTPRARPGPGTAGLAPRSGTESSGAGRRQGWGWGRAARRPAPRRRLHTKGTRGLPAPLRRPAHSAAHPAAAASPCRSSPPLAARRGLPPRAAAPRRHQARPAAKRARPARHLREEVPPRFTAAPAGGRKGRAGGSACAAP